MTAPDGRIVVLVDGSNVARSSAWAAAMRRDQSDRLGAGRQADADPRARLLDQILEWTTVSGTDVVVVFDGEGPLGAGRSSWSRAFLVIGAGSTDGDTVVEQEAARLRREGAQVRLVTDDHALANVAGAHAQAVLGVDHFVAQLATGPADELDVDHVHLVRDRESRPGTARPGTARPGTARPGRVQPDDAHSRIGDSVDDDVRARLERLRRGDA
jgi:predicted RNA-binding protein with PIN domain